MEDGIPQQVKWLAFAGWLILPVAVAWTAYAFLGLPFLWTGPVWMALALAYMVFYFRWVRRRNG